MRERRRIGKRCSVWERALRRALPPAVATAAIVLIAAPVALGHSTVRPGSSRPADLQVYTLTVPNERDVVTDSVALQVPEGIDFVLARNAPGWKVEVERRGDRIATLRWSSGTIAPDFYDSLQFIARNPVAQGTITWKVIQHYGDGQTVRWIGPAGSDTPASRTRITESATPQDVVSVHGKEAAASTGAPTADAPTVESQDNDDDLPLVLALVAIGLSLAAVLTSFLRGRRTGA